MGEHFGAFQRRKSRGLAVALRAGRAIADGCGAAVRRALVLRRGAAVRRALALRRRTAVRCAFAFRRGTTVRRTLPLLCQACTDRNVVSLRGNAFRYGIVWCTLADCSGHTFEYNAGICGQSWRCNRHRHNNSEQPRCEPQSAFLVHSIFLLRFVFRGHSPIYIKSALLFSAERLLQIKQMPIKKSLIDFQKQKGATSCRTLCSMKDLLH